MNSHPEITDEFAAKVESALGYLLATAQPDFIRLDTEKDDEPHSVGAYTFEEDDTDREGRGVVVFLSNGVQAVLTLTLEESRYPNAR
ncbi:hypothetical protein [Microbispora sp. NPDC049125]|uniref:hypothetical protein n=1 Tax=Microbispora sp. NPDC049125 TaxID=3154929 RepID=UPI003465A3C0